MTLYDCFPYPYDCNYPPVADTRILFKQLVLDNIEDIKTYMTWENYDLNETVLPVIEKMKDHALITLMNSYGLFPVEQDILEPLFADIFIYFPILMQQLAITRLIDSAGVVKNDTDIVSTTRTEILAGNTEQNSELTQGTAQTDSNLLNTETKTTGTIAVDSDIDQTQSNTTDIINDSGVLATGTKNINLTHNMPEQSIDAVTGNFLVDPQGTPILSPAYVQEAAATYSTSNPINTTETSHQTAENTTIGSNNALTTNNVTVADTGTTTRTTTNSGSDNSNSTTVIDNTNTTNETITSTLTNKQYAYEIKAFLETADSLIAFRKWEDNFSWVVGII